MNEPKTECTLRVYEHTGPEVEPDKPFPPFSVKNHRVRDDYVVICIGDDQYTVVASQLLKAINRCSGGGL